MSFSTEQKLEIINQQYKNSCCKRALFDGILSSKASVSDGLISFNINSDEVIAFILAIIKDIYGKEAAVSRSKTGGRAKTVSFSSPAAVRYIESLSGVKDMCSSKCPLCKSAFLKGMFLASGRVADPQKQYLLEFSLVNKCELFLEFLSSFGIEAKFNERKREKILYIKKSSEIEDFFGFAGMNSTAFQFINAKIKNEIRNNANRLANCETNNIDKAVTASHPHIVAINELKKRGLLSSLPEELERTARLRLEHEDLSLSALAKISVPAISKSGLSHRLNKIMELSKSLLEK